MADFTKDPDSVLDYKFDWKSLTNNSVGSDWLESGETISTKLVTVEAGLTKDSDVLADTNTSVVVWLSGGTAGQTYSVTCRITTSLGRTEDKTITIDVSEK